MDKKIVQQFVRFGIVGLSNTLIGYGVYFICIYIGLHYLIANLLGFIVGVLNAYYWSDRFVFKKEDGESRSFIGTLIKTFLAYGSTGLLLSSLLLYIYIDKFHISEYVAQLCVLAVTIPLNFIINKYWSFKTKKNDEEN